MVALSVVQTQSILSSAGLDVETIENIEDIRICIESVLECGLSRFNSPIPTQPELDKHYDKIQKQIKALNQLLSDKYVMAKIDSVVERDQHPFDTAKMIEINSQFSQVVNDAKTRAVIFYAGGAFLGSSCKNRSNNPAKLVKWLAINMRPIWKENLNQVVTLSKGAPYTLFLAAILDLAKIKYASHEAIRDHVKRTKNCCPQIVVRSEAKP